MDARTCDVMIVGAGPSGMAAALAAHAAGLSLRLVDRHAGRLAFSRAILVNPATRAALASYGIDADLAARGRPVAHVSLRDFSGALAEAPLYSVADSPAPLLLPQLQTEAAMEAALAARGIGIERPLALADFREDDEGIVATLALPDGPTESVRTAWLVGADGYNSAVRTGADISFPGDDLPAKLQSLDLEMDWP